MVCTAASCRAHSSCWLVPLRVTVSPPLFPGDEPSCVEAGPNRTMRNIHSLFKKKGPGANALIQRERMSNYPHLAEMARRRDAAKAEYARILKERVLNASRARTAATTNAAQHRRPRSATRDAK